MLRLKFKDLVLGHRHVKGPPTPAIYLNETPTLFLVVLCLVLCVILHVVLCLFVVVLRLFELVLHLFVVVLRVFLVVLCLI